mmetsp:Transcript_3268/g.8355  ORF Transcript_3268/g.8355 Transcript_3268/m.8355 type:complete len:241 (+) Transcript_3268:129-851(+)
MPTARIRMKLRRRCADGFQLEKIVQRILDGSRGIVFCLRQEGGRVLGGDVERQSLQVSFHDTPGVNQEADIRTAVLIIGTINSCVRSVCEPSRNVSAKVRARGKATEPETVRINVELLSTVSYHTHGTFCILHRCSTKVHPRTPRNTILQHKRTHSNRVQPSRSRDTFLVPREIVVSTTRGNHDGRSWSGRVHEVRRDCRHSDIVNVTVLRPHLCLFGPKVPWPFIGNKSFWPNGQRSGI